MNDHANARLALLRGPGVEVLADHEAGVEAGTLRLGAPAEQVGGVELLEHRGVADGGHADLLGPGSAADVEVIVRAEPGTAA